ncbi:LOW QUALITY PROTEIN: zinc finger and BTB domain-containing protein 26-like [Leucoraja erinacea]|uniref:LOW QUALITY PROTEIN: zinc finger and BTB domain-containing protein 26-like n=1 Tax=Leucoraja erinaceus TaxID=7782 RepID=UPI002455FF94|nr:LOW QUALITY PROTEIN: zinc finger and BTB domain-containing protein 26-like [Leucoraja erinacea]
MSLNCRARNRSGESPPHSHSTKQIPYSAAAAAAAAMSSEDVVRFHFASHEVSILRRMNQLRLEERFCDVTIVAERLRFPGHRVVLAACSPFLRDQFHMNPSREVQVFPMTGAQAVQRLLLSCYTGTLEFPFRDILDYLTAASCLQMEHVVEKCRQSLSPRIGPRLPLPPATGPDERERPATPQIASSSERDGPWGEAGEAVKLERELGGQQPQPRPRPRPLGGGGGGGFGAPDQLRIRKVESLADCMAARGLGAGTGAGARPAHPLHRRQRQRRRRQWLPRRLLGGRDFRRTGWRGGPALRHVRGADHGRLRRGGLRELGQRGLPLRAVPGGAGVGGVGAAGRVGYDAAAVAARCSECGADFEQREHLAAHMVTHRLYMCLLCGKVFKKNARLAQHINVHTGFKPYCCAVCGRTFTQKRSLKDHMNVHNGDAPHCCSYCDMRFTHYSTLRVHLRDQHGTTTTRNLDNKPTVISMVVP